MNIRLSHWQDGVCFKCVRHTQCGTIGDAAHKCDQYQLDKSRWHDENTQKWEWILAQQIKRSVKAMENPQTSLARWYRWE